MQINNSALLIISVLVIVARVLAFVVCKIQGHPIRTLKLNAFFKQQPWLPAVLVIVDCLGVYALARFHFMASSHTVYIALNVGSGVIQAILTVWLLLAEANAVYAWLSQLAASKSLLHALLPYAKNGIRFIFLVLCLPLITESFSTYMQTQAMTTKITQLLIIWAIVWLVIQIIAALEKVTLRRLQESLAMDFQARSLYTQVRVFKRIVIIIVSVLGLAASAMVFDHVRELGTSLLASAGVATVILGIAAQKTLGGILAGIQIAITQPIRIDDLIVVENEFGTVEEITLSYVVLRIWDLRRLIIPINYFIENPFQNLTRASTEILSPFFLYTDCTLPVALVREKLTEIVKASEFWDGNVVALQVVEAQANGSMKLRILVSAKDSPTAWNLKCEVLEKLLAFIAEEYPESLPKARNLALTP